MTHAPAPASDESVYFPSLVSLRAAHTELLKRHRETGETPETLAAVAAFLRRGQATGALLDDDDDRRAAQSLLNYWTALLYRAGQEPPEATLADFDPTLAPELPDALCPYLGLDAFREDNSDVFFGRQRLIESLIDHLQENRLLAVVGPSGSGKSSVVRAGLIPALQAGAPASDSADWHYLPPMFPGSNPLENLAHVTRPPEIDAAAWVPSQIVAFQQDDGYLANMIAARGLGRVVIVVDQFEEVFTLCTDDNVRQAFVDNLVRLIRAPQARHTVILTMRTDFETQVTRLPDFEPLFEQALIRVTPLNAGELREAIEKPAAAIGLKFEAGVVDALLRDILGEPAALPLLQFTLLKLWESRERNRVTWEAYRRLGGGRQALATSADDFYRNLIQEEQDTARRILLRLVRPGEGLEFTSSRVRREALFHKAEARDRVERVLDKFIRARLLRLTQGETEADDQVEVAHEALVRNWPRLVGWLEDERVAMRQRQRLTTAAEQWEALGRDPGALLRGVLLDEALRTEDLNELEHEFVRASAASREAEEEERVRAREQALQAEMAQKVAEVERQRAEEQTRAANQLRQRAWYLRIAFGVAILLFAIAAVLAGQANRSATRANDNASTAEAAQVTAVFERQNADAASAYAFDQKATAEAERDEADEARAEAEEQHQLVEQQRQIAFSRQLAAQAAKLDNQPDLALLLSVTAGNVTETVDAKSSLLKGLMVSPFPIYLRSHTGGINGVAYRRDGQVLATVAEDGALILWDTVRHKMIGQPLKHTSGETIRSVAFSPDGSILATGGGDSTIVLWDMVTRQPISEPLTGHTDWINSVAFSPDGKILASGSADATIRLWDVATRQPIGEPLTGHTSGVFSVAFSPDGKILASGSADTTIRLWDVATRKPLGKPLAGHTSSIYTVAFRPDGALLASAGDDRTIRLWEVATRKPFGEPFTGHTDYVWNIAFSPDGTQLASGSGDQTIRRWSVPDGSLIGEPLRGHGDAVWGANLAFSPDGRFLASGGGDNAVILWDLEGAQIGNRALHGHTATVVGLAFNNSQRLVSGSQDNTLYVWDIRSGQPVGPALQGRTQVPAALTGIAFSPDGKRLASGTYDGAIVFWDAQTHQPIGKPLKGHNAPINSIAFSPDGKFLASAGGDANIILWNMTTSLSQTLAGHTDQVMSVAFSPNGERLASGSADNTILLWDTATGKPLSPPLKGHLATVSSVAFSPDGKALASASWDGTVILWDLSHLDLPIEPRLTLTGHTDWVNTVAFSPDGKRLASGSYDQAIILWDVETGQAIGQPIAVSSVVYSVAFSPGGKTLASGNQDSAVTLWDLSNPRSPFSKPSLSGHTDRVQAVAFSPDGQMLASASSDRTLRLWNAISGEAVGDPLRSLTSESVQLVSSLALSPDGQTLASGGEEGTILLWDVYTSTYTARSQSLSGHSGKVMSLAFSPDGTILASGGAEGSLFLWDVSTGQRLRELRTDRVAPVISLAFSPNGQNLAAGSKDTILLWEVAAGNPIGKPLKGHRADITSLVFSPDGQTLASGDSLGAILLRDVATRQLRGGKPLIGYTTNPEVSPQLALRLAFSPDGKVLASANDNSTEVTLWDVDTSQQIGRLNLGASVSSLAFSPDGQTLGAGGASGAIHLWDADPHSWAARACQLVARNLTWAEWYQYLFPVGQPYLVTCPNNSVDFTDLANGFLGQAQDYLQVEDTPQVAEALNSAVYWAVQAETAAPSVSTCRLGSLDFAKEVRAACRNAAQLASDSLTRADMHALAGDTLKASEAFTEAIQSALKSEDADLNKEVCRLGSLDGLAASVLPACNRAIQLAPESDRGLYRDSRGLARALTGDYPGAAADFEAYNDWAQAFDSYAERIAMRKDWIEALKAKQNPFADPATLYAIRIELSP